jgi:hypothetical protein
MKRSTLGVGLAGQSLAVAMVVAALAVLAQGCGASKVGSAIADGSDVNPTAAALEQFHERIDAYMELREDVVDDVGDAERTSDAAEIRGRERTLGNQLRARRANARHGNIFTPEVRPVFRRLLRPEFRGESGQDIRDRLDDDAPAPGAVPIEVNATYPAPLPFPTTPTLVLQALPALPAGLEYRILGKDLILLDQPADLILDYIRNAVP